MTTLGDSHIPGVLVEVCCWDHAETQLSYLSLGHIPVIPLLSQAKLLKTC